MKRSPVATVRRTARRAVTWRPKSGGAIALSVESLISPLRYDVAVRAQFFALVARHLEAGPLDPDLLVAAARGEPYFTWFERVAMPRFRPWVLADPALLLDQFRERVLSAAALWQSFGTRGFDPAHPVTLRAGNGPLPTDSGLLVDRPLHVGDGGHRLALLLAADQPLEPEMYRVDPRPMRQLIDNTAVLVPALGLSAQAYVRFVSRGYAEAMHDEARALLADVRQHAPERSAELRAVLERQRPGVELQA